MSVVHVSGQVPVDLPGHAGIEQSCQGTAPEAGAADVPEEIVIVSAAALVPEVAAGGEPQVVQRGPGLDILRWLEDQFGTQVIAVHHVVERKLRIKPRGGKKLEKRAMDVAAVAAAARGGDVSGAHPGLPRRVDKTVA